MAFVRRRLRTTFRLGEGAFGNSGNNVATVMALRASAQITKAGGQSMSTMQLQIYGMDQTLMDQLSTLGLLWTLTRRNTVTLEAGDEGGVFSTVFAGTITNAWTDLQAAPDIPFRVEAQAGLLEAVSTAEPSSYPGPTDAALIMSSLASQMDLTFENSGVNVILPSSYFYGSPRNQAKACAEAGNFNWLIDNNVLAIWPKGTSRGGSVPLISSDSGMVNYPTYTSKGVFVSTLFNPSIAYGGKVQVESDQKPANGEWIVYQLNYDLDDNVVNGKWFTGINATRPGLGPVV